MDGQARNATWHLNVAFLLAYEEDLRTAIREYRRAVEQEAVETDLIAKIEDFVYYIATAEPEKYQLFLLPRILQLEIQGRHSSGNQGLQDLP
jgi:hypothetical protein